MKNIVKFSLMMAATIVLLPSCATLWTASVSSEQEYNDIWVGRTHSEIVMTYGAPDRIESDGADGRCYLVKSNQRMPDGKAKQPTLNEQLTIRATFGQE